MYVYLLAFIINNAVITSLICSLCVYMRIAVYTSITPQSCRYIQKLSYPQLCIVVAFFSSTSKKMSGLEFIALCKQYRTVVTLQKHAVVGSNITKLEIRSCRQGVYTFQVINIRGTYKYNSVCLVSMTFNVFLLGNILLN